MSRIFDSYLIVDWSAASKPTTGADSIWIGALTPDARMNLKFTAINPDTRTKAKAQLIAAIERLTKRGDRVLLGFDFPMGYPVGTAQALKLNITETPPWKAMHDFLSSGLKDKADNTNNRFALAARMNRIISDGAFPFWGCPKKDVITTLSDKKPRDHAEDDIPEYRFAERRALSQKKGKPQSVWKLAYAGAAGGQAFTGIPAVQDLKSHFGNDMAIWPFETGWVENPADLPQVVVAEIYPSILKITPESGRVKDEIQVESLAKWFAEIDSNGQLRTRLARPEVVSEEESLEILAEEGWILGI